MTKNYTYSGSKYYQKVGRRKLRTSGIFLDEMGLTDKPKLAAKVKATIQELVEAHLNTGEFFSNQDSCDIAEIKGGLSRKFPEIFEDTAVKNSRRHRKMARAMDYARRYFQVLRSKYEDSDEDDNHSDETLEYDQKRSPNTFVPSQNQPAYSTQPVPAHADNVTPTNPYASLSSLSWHPIHSAPQLPSPVPAPVQTFEQPPEHGSRPEEVATFLQSCKPSMEFLFDSFMAFGCRNRKFLEAVAKLDYNEIEEFLRGVIRHSPPFGDSDTVPEMWVWLLKKHLKRYFLSQLAPEGSK
ncbi:hypothetical protein D9756_003043 [Leucocoprinus leucothites]|uniref:Uncharacterized protein n=1 Tax=Leucocoprinus leucothites TaxID=201217 RepID=A0A8H5LJV3_9AGAR|nr:hypothetical protein D9756_003043 [Leucoagaricus leucothites]